MAYIHPMIKRTTIIVCGALLSGYILIPLFTSLFLLCSLNVPNGVYLYAVSALQVLGASTASLITGVLVSTFNKGAERAASIWVSLLTAILLVYFTMQGYALAGGTTVHLIMELVAEVAGLLFAGLIASYFVVKWRQKSQHTTKA